MGACGSSLAAAAPAGGSSDPYAFATLWKGAAGMECTRAGSILDMSRVPNVEKKMQSSSGDVPESFGYACRKGQKTGMVLPNQDSWSAHVVPQHLAAYGVFDGHGERGHLISDYVRASLLPNVLKAATAGVDDPSAKVEACFRSAHQAVCSAVRLGARNSGTTATVVVHDMQKERLVVSHVGDSKAVLLKSGKGDEGALVAQELTRDHKPELEDERARIVKNGGRVVFDGGCHRVTAARSWSPGLNMSRSLGDQQAHNACGVSALPEVSVCSVGPEHRAILVASDGIWEVITPSCAAAIVQSFGPDGAMEAAAKLAEEARARWSEGTDGRVIDDITVVLAWLPQSKLSPSLDRYSSCTGESIRTMAPVLPPSPADTVLSTRSRSTFTTATWSSGEGGSADEEGSGASAK